jgi:pimeloyl-ACP methyl ester carboxylesterase
MTETQHGFADIGNARLAYTTAGSGDQAVVFIHAGIADRTMWADQVPAFAEHFTTVTYDMRGFGESEMVDEPYSSRADLATLLDVLDIDGTHVVGCSMGGAAALQFAVQYPDRTKSLVLVNSGAPGFEPEGGHFEFPQWGRAVAAFEAGDFEQVAELDVEMWVDGPYREPDQVPAATRDAVRTMDLPALRNESRRDEFEDGLDPPVGIRLAEITCPTLVVLGELDMPDMSAYAEHLATGIAGARLVSIPDVAHLPNMEKPAEFNDLILSFLKRVPA